MIWTLNGTVKLGNIIPSPDQAAHAYWQVVAALDYDGDGHRDLLWYNVTTGKIVQWLMDAGVVRLSGRFTNPSNAGNANWQVLAGGDYGVGTDGVACSNDLVWRNSTTGKEVVWFMDGNPTSPLDWTLAGPR